MSDDLTGQTLGQFQIQRRLGQGAMGAVYVATHTATGKKVAVKVIIPIQDQTKAAKLAARFEREIKLLGQFRHPNIVRFYGASEDRGIRYYAMELVDGTSLDQILDQRPVLPLKTATHYAIQICEALQEMHATGIIHRDLKPGNVLVSKDDKVKLTDFGIARDTSALSEERLTAADHTVGTIAYMSPEQLGGAELTRKSDLYSFGILLYRMLTGSLPFNGETMFEYMKQRQSGIYQAPTTVNADLPLDIDRLLGELMALSPDDRPRDAYVVMQRLMELRDRSSESPPTKGRPKTKVAPALAETIEAPAGRVSTLLATVFGKRRGKGKAKSKNAQRAADGPRPPFWESPVVLGLALLAVIGFVVYMLWPPGPAERFARGSAIFHRADVTLDEMVRADQDYFVPILEDDPASSFASDIALFREQMALKRARGRANLALANRQMPPEASEAEQKYINALLLKDYRDDRVNAEEQLRALARVFARDPAAKPWVTLAQEQLEKSLTFDSKEERIEAKRRSVRAALDRASALREEGKRRDALDEYASIEKLYDGDDEVADLIWKEGPNFVPVEDLIRAGEKLMASPTPADWTQAFTRYFDPILAKGPSEEIRAKIAAFDAQRQRAQAEKKTQEDLSVGLPVDAPEPEAMYVTAIFIRDQLKDDLGAHDALARLIGRFEADRAAVGWVALAQQEMETTRQIEIRDQRRLEKQAQTERALGILDDLVDADPDKHSWKARVYALYRDDGDSNGLVQQHLSAQENP